MRLIDADALMEIYMDRLSLVADRYSPDSSECGILTGAAKLLDAQQTIEPEHKTGKWIMKYKGSAVTSYKCSECGRTVKDDTGYDVSKDYPFCHCGADMREGQDGER